MTNGWPHSGDGQGPNPANQGHGPFAPEVSWPTGYSESGYSGTGYSGTDYRGGGYPAAAPGPAELTAGGTGSHPYAAFHTDGYGDDGYADPGYQGPAAQDAGIAGTRTVRGFVENDRGQHGYPSASAAQAGYTQPGFAQSGPAGTASGQQGYAGSSYAGGGQIEMAYPPSADGGSGLHQQPWDYDQPLRYDGEEDSYPSGGYGQQPAAYDPDSYNGSEYSMPGINGPGYDLSGIIGTNDFEAIGYDEPSYGRLSYDDPRYAEPGDFPQVNSGGFPQAGGRYPETRMDNQVFDETRMDNGWGVFPGGGSGSPATPAGLDRTSAKAEAAKTRYDMTALSGLDRRTRFDLPVYDETRMDNLRTMTPARGLRPAGTAVLAPPAAPPRSWAEDTSLDHFADLDLTDEPVPAAFTRTISRPAEREQDDDTATRRAVGRRRGRSGDRRQWMALGAIAVVAAGAIGGVLMKYVFSGPSGPAHHISAPQTVGGFARSANLEKQLKVDNLAKQVADRSGGQASGLANGVYQQGGGGIAAGSSTQIFMFVGGKLAGADPAASVANFEQTYKDAKTVDPGSFGGQEACTTTVQNGQSAAMCVWFDNDTFGTVVSPTMTTAKLAATMNAVRPSFEQVAK